MQKGIWVFHPSPLFVLVAAEGFETASDNSQDRAESQHNSANSTQYSAVAATPHTADMQKSALPQQNPSTSGHEATTATGWRSSVGDVSMARRSSG